MNSPALSRSFDLVMQAHARRILIVSFGALALATLAAQAETRAGATPALESPATPPAEARPVRGGPSVEAAFARADVDRDGRLTRQEAARFPAISARFDKIDSDGDGRLDLIEFEAGAQPQP